MKPHSPQVPQIKICGITQVAQAEWCAELGADAVGCVFFPKSPRHLPQEKATDICKALPEHVMSVGVFVNTDYSAIMRKVEKCGLRAVQLHGKETPELVQQLQRQDLIIIKALFMDGIPSLENANTYDADGYLVECSGGPLPGGNAMVWNWDQAKDFGEKYPFTLAGGLSPENVKTAVHAAMPDAVDVSSGVESSPGKKDRDKIKAFIKAVKQIDAGRALRNIY